MNHVIAPVGAKPALKNNNYIATSTDRRPKRGLCQLEHSGLGRVRESVANKTRRVPPTLMLVFYFDGEVVVFQAGTKRPRLVQLSTYVWACMHLSKEAKTTDRAASKVGHGVLINAVTRISPCRS